MSSSLPWTRVTTLCTTCKSSGRSVSTVVNVHLSPHLTVTPVCLSDNLYNTNSGFDWGAFRKLEEELTLSWSPPSFFSMVLSQPGVYVFKLSSHPHRHMVKKPCFPNLVNPSLSHYNRYAIESLQMWGWCQIHHREHAIMCLSVWPFRCLPVCARDARRGPVPRTWAVLSLYPPAHDQNGNQNEEQPAPEARLAGDWRAAFRSRRHPLHVCFSPGQWT